MAKRNRVSDADAALFRDAVGPVKRLRGEQVLPEHRRPAPRPSMTPMLRQQVLQDLLSGEPRPEELETGDELLFSRPGVQHKLLRKLRRGQFSTAAELDLHGLVVADAKRALADFLRECRQRDLRCVRIIHGKGLRSPQGRPVIKSKLDRWLRLREEVVAFCSARPVDGGTGAIYVLLKRS